MQKLWLEERGWRGEQECVRGWREAGTIKWAAGGIVVILTKRWNMCFMFFFFEENKLTSVFMNELQIQRQMVKGSEVITEWCDKEYSQTGMQGG